MSRSSNRPRSGSATRSAPDGACPLRRPASAQRAGSVHLPITPHTRSQYYLLATQLPEGLLLKSIARGDRDAFDELYRQYYPRLVRYLAQRFPPSHSTDEIVDDTFMIIWQHAGGFRYQSQVSTWIFGIAYRVALRSLQRNKRWLTVEEDPSELVFDPTHEAEEHDWLAEGLRRLPDKQRVCILLSYQMGLSVRQVAVITKSAAGTVKAHMFHARKKLRHLLLALQ